jgi:hypothetical protein
MGRLVDGSTGRLVDGSMGRWVDGSMGRWVESTASPWFEFTSGFHMLDGSVVRLPRLGDPASRDPFGSPRRICERAR